MSKEKPEYALVENFSELVGTAIAKNEDRFGHIDHRTIRMAVITNKEAPEGNDGLIPFKITRINNPVALVCPVRYFVTTWQQSWDDANEDRKALLIFDVLFSIDPDEDEPKLITPDVKAHGIMLRTFGVDYMKNPNLKGLLSKPIEWKEVSDFEGLSEEDDKPEKKDLFDDLDKFNDTDFDPT